MTRATSIPDTVTIHVPFRVVKRGGRKEMQLPEGGTHPARTDSTLVKALARAFRWKRMLESGEFATIAELAEREGIAPSYMTRILRLTLLAPDIVDFVGGIAEAIGEQRDRQFRVVDRAVVAFTIVLHRELPVAFLDQVDLLLRLRHRERELQRQR